jgi:hypothetical protein
VGYLISGRNKTKAYQNDTLVAMSNVKADPSTFRRRFDAGATLCIGYNTKVYKDIALIIQVAGNLGFYDLTAATDTYFFPRTLNLSVGIVIPNSINKHF